MVENQQRKLQAVLFADITGYTQMMQRDEQEALRRLTRFKEVIEEKVTDYHGKIIQYYGDGCLAVFDSSVKAIQFAKSLQEKLYTGMIVPVRVGIHLGEVLFRQGNAYGNSVNIASRIESLGIPGSVLFSEAVKNQIENHPEFSFVGTGRFNFKNVEEPMEVYALSVSGLPVPEKTNMKGKLAAPPLEKAQSIGIWSNWVWITVAVIALFALGTFFFLSTPLKKDVNVEIEKSIAVLPFKNLSADENNRFFCDGVMEAVLDHLSKIKGLKVIARTSVERYQNNRQSIKKIAKELGVSYILEGSVQREKNKVRVLPRLILANQENQLWSGKYDRELTDIFSIQSEIAEEIARELELKISPEIKAVFANRPTSNLSAYEYYLRGRENMVKFYFDQQDMDFENAWQNFENALALDSLMAPVYDDMARLLWINHWMRVPLGYISLDSLRMLCEKAISIDPSLPQAHCTLGWYYNSIQEEDKFLEAQYKALALNENFAPAYQALGWYFTHPERLDEFEKGITFYNKAIELDPNSPWTLGYYWDLAQAYLHINALEEAEYYGKKIREAGDFSSWSTLAHVYLVQGKYEKVEELAEEWLVKSPQALRYLSESEMNFHHNYKKAIRQYQEFEKHFPDQINYRQRFGLAYILDGQPEKGIPLIEKAIEEYETDIELYGALWCYDLAGCYATLGNTQKALEILGDQNCILPAGLEMYITHDLLFKNLWEKAEFKQIIERKRLKTTRVRERVRQNALKN